MKLRLGEWAFRRKKFKFIEAICENGICWLFIEFN